MLFHRVLTLLPCLLLFSMSSSATPHAESDSSVDKRYNPFFPPDTALISHDQLTDRASIASAGQSELIARKVVEKRGKRHGKRGQHRKVRRADGKCAVRNTTATSIAGSTTSALLVASPISTASTYTSKSTAQAATTSTTTAHATAPSSKTKTSTSTTKASTSTRTTASTSTTTSASRVSVDPYGDGPFSGWGTYFDVGLGACGWTNTAADPIVAISAELFDQWPGYNGWNPNANPICGKHLEITWGGKSLVVEVADRCPGCSIRSLDLSIGVFEHFATLDVGLLGMDTYTKNITWSWVGGSGSLPQVPVS